MLLVAVVLELAVISVLVRPFRDSAKLVAIVWLCSVFWTYRLGLAWIDFRGYCQCLGSMSDWLHISPTIADGMSKAILVVLTTGAIALLVWELRQPTAENVKTP